MNGIESIKKMNESAVRVSLNDNAEDIGLSASEVQEIRQIAAKTGEQARIGHHEKLSSLRSKARWILKSLLDRCRALKEYQAAEIVGHRHGNGILRIPDGKEIGFRFPEYVSGTTPYFYETFKFWGFERPEELYCLPQKLTDEFFDRGIAFVEGIYGKEGEVDQEEDPVQLELLKLKAEDLTTETRAALGSIAQDVKAKGESE